MAGSPHGQFLDSSCQFFGSKLLSSNLKCNNIRILQTMRITVVAVGKIKEKYLRDGIAEYGKRLSKMSRTRSIYSSFRKWSRSEIIPNLNSYSLSLFRYFPIYAKLCGVRMPKLRKMAKEIAKGDFGAYLAEAAQGIGEGAYHCCSNIPRLPVKRVLLISHYCKYLIKLQSFGKIECGHCQPLFKRRCMSVNIIYGNTFVLKNTV